MKKIFNLSLKKNKENSSILFVSLSNVLSNIFLIISGVLVAQWITPENLGLFNSYTLYSTYILLLHLGIPISFGRELPYQIGKGDITKANSFAEVAQYYSITLSIVSFSILILFGFYFFTQGLYQHAVGSLVIGALCVDGFYVTQYLKNTFRGKTDFNVMSRINIYVTIFSFSTIIFVYYFGFYGLALRTLLTVSFGLSLNFKKRPIKLKPKYDRIIFKELIKKGFPMYIVTQVYSLWPIIQKTIILSFGGPIALGLFSLSLIIESGITALSSAVGNVTYVDMATKWGKGENIQQLFMNSIKPILVSACILLILIPIGWKLIPLMVQNFLPNFKGGLEASKWAMISGFIALFNVLTNIYNVVGNQRHKLISFILGLFGWLICLQILYSFRGFQLVILPQSMAMGYLIILSYNLLFIYKNRFATHFVSV